MRNEKATPNRYRCADPGNEGSARLRLSTQAQPTSREAKTAMMLKEAVVLTALALGQVPTIVDGDTVKLAGIRIRLTDYDSPELYSPKCPAELSRAQAAKAELEQLISQIKLEIVPCAFHNYGRLCAEGTIEGKPLAAHMIDRGLASPYVCHPGWCPQKRNWC